MQLPLAACAPRRRPGNLARLGEIDIGGRRRFSIRRPIQTASTTYRASRSIASLQAFSGVLDELAAAACARGESQSLAAGLRALRSPSTGAAQRRLSSPTLDRGLHHRPPGRIPDVAAQTQVDRARTGIIWQSRRQRWKRLQQTISAFARGRALYGIGKTVSSASHANRIYACDSPVGLTSAESLARHENCCRKSAIGNCDANSGAVTACAYGRLGRSGGRTNALDLGTIGEYRALVSL